MKKRRKLHGWILAGGSIVRAPHALCAIGRIRPAVFPTPQTQGCLRDEHHTLRPALRRHARSDCAVHGSGGRGRNDSDAKLRVKRGFAIAPVMLDFAVRNRELVGLGSYIVNSTGCNDCHTHPSYAAGGNPYANQAEQVNEAQYLSGGRTFGPFVAPNLTPDASGKPAGLTFAEFVTVMRTGQTPDNPPGVLLQVMPWPAFGKMTDNDLAAIYQYLRAIPSLPDNPAPGP
jgi:hypothetical protein